MLLKNLKSSYPINELTSELILEVQQCLASGKYLTSEQVDGVAGAAVLTAFAQFKKDVWLDEPNILGFSTAQALLRLKEKHLGTGEASEKPIDLTASGKTMRLPDGTSVFASQFIVPGIPLTWGEVTKGCSRIPTENYQLQNAIALAKTFGELREKFGSSILITSGFRPAAVNRAVGGVSNSQHVPFKALDMQPMNGDFTKLWQCLKASRFTGLGDGVSTGKGFYHADIRDNGRIIFGY